VRSPGFKVEAETSPERAPERQHYQDLTPLQGFAVETVDPGLRAKRFALGYYVPAFQALRTYSGESYVRLPGRLAEAIECY